jgi:hypothetical protein
MQGYSKGSVLPFKTVHFNDYVEAFIQGYSMGIVLPQKTVYYNL